MLSCQTLKKVRKLNNSAPQKGIVTRTGHCTKGPSGEFVSPFGKYNCDNLTHFDSLACVNEAAAYNTRESVEANELLTQDSVHGLLVDNWVLLHHLCVREKTGRGSKQREREREEKGRKSAQKSTGK